ncbi:hypothetical protein ATT74_20665 [Salmonella enterica subsp. enterica serovar Panama]|uniref:Uncharacterized protein n=1 Tax=Salmonella enterica subsp. enterica serovar Panama TaxID=29472 RepID=A0A619ADI3_SALET|nr:hypothetical protein [Salmonella enterica subsp. enterica serovar Panama]ECX3497011.1 hypothetical protein [Salmonella enterica subsp. enterica serovar Panama]ECX6034441.1 hypothetical protein [Salmonella enterica subsp. enterica serovar Panama]EGU5383882.1 hypothetical protein [Salmonella enterica]EGX1717886.1 hypothetical protein [Salmonella enterica subsp. enterica serovar Panama]
MNLNMYSEIKAMLADAISLRDEQKLAEVKIALLDKITRAQEQYVDLYEKYMQLLQEKSVLESEVNEISQYELHLLSKKAGFWAYRFITDDEEKLHYLCQTCWDSTHKNRYSELMMWGFVSARRAGMTRGCI